MTLEELKAAADEMGFKLVKKPEPLPKLLPCTCGRKRLGLYYEFHEELGGWGKCYKCPACRLKGEPGKNERQLRENWNKVVSELEGGG